MKIKENVILASIVFTGIILLGCSDEDSKPFKTGKRPKLNIGDASGIVVYDQSDNIGGRRASTSGNLFKITIDGRLEQVRSLYNDGTEISGEAELSVSRVYNINDQYFILDGEFLVWDTLGNRVQYHTLLVRKTDGVIFEFRHPSHYGSDIRRSFDLEDETFYSDNSGDFYYLNISQNVLKVDVSDPSNIYMMDYLPSGQTTTHYAIDGDGNCIYRHGYGNVLRVKKKSGGLHELTAADDHNDFWVGNNGKIYTASWGSGKRYIHHVTINEFDDVTAALVWESTEDLMIAGFYDRNQYFKIKKQNSIVFIGLDNAKPWEFFEETNEAVEFELPKITSNAKVVYSDDYYYIATGTNLYKVSFQNHSYENLLTPGQYEVYEMSVNNAEVLQLSALRFSDGKKIIAALNGQQFTVIDEEQDRDIMYLQQLN